jgi:hypothetical protein
MKNPDFKYLPISKTSETLSLDSPEFEKIKKAYVEQVLPKIDWDGYDLDTQAISLQKITLFFEGGKTRMRYVLLLLEPTFSSEIANAPSKHLLVAFMTAYELAGKMKISFSDVTDESICLCHQYEDNIHLN